MTRIRRATRTRVMAAVVFASTAAACAAREAPRAAHVAREPSVWRLDREPVPRTVDEALDALQRGLGENNIARLRIAEEDVAITLVPTLGRWMQDHWGLTTGGPLAQYFEAVENREHNVEDDEIVAAIDGRSQAGGAIVHRRHTVTVAAQRFREQRAQLVVVVHEEDGGRVSHRVLR